MFKKILLSAALLAPTPLLAKPGFGPGNGGDVVVCKPSSQNPFNGMYTLDYLMTYNAFNNNQDIVNVNSIEESLARTRLFVKKFMWSQLASFDNFVAHLGNHTDFSKSRIWLAVPSSKLINIADENLIRMVPSNCNQNQGDVEVIQAVIRFPGETIRYEVDFQVFQQLQKTPLQLSFLLVHEWLRDVTQDSETIRQVNRVIHSSSWENSDVMSTHKVLQKWNFQDTLPNSISKLMLTAIVDNNIVALRSLIDKGFLSYASKDLSGSIFNLSSDYVSYNVLDENGIFTNENKSVRLNYYVRDWAWAIEGNSITPLAFAILMNHKEQIQLLMEKGLPHVNAQDNRAVLAALGTGQIALAYKLLDYGFKNVFTEEQTLLSYSFLHLSLVRTGNLDLIKKVCAFPSVKCSNQDLAMFAAFTLADVNILNTYKASLDSLTKEYSEQQLASIYGNYIYLKGSQEITNSSYASCGSKCGKYVKLQSDNKTIVLKLIQILSERSVTALEVLKKSNLLPLKSAVRVSINENSWTIFDNFKSKRSTQTWTLQQYGLWAVESYKEGRLSPEEIQLVKRLQAVFR